MQHINTGLLHLPGDMQEFTTGMAEVNNYLVIFGLKLQYLEDENQVTLVKMHPDDLLENQQYNQKLFDDQDIPDDFKRDSHEGLLMT